MFGSYFRTLAVSLVSDLKKKKKKKKKKMSRCVNVVNLENDKWYVFPGVYTDMYWIQSPSHSDKPCISGYRMEVRTALSSSVASIKYK